MKNNGEATGEFADDSKMPEERVISLGSKMYNGDCIENLNLRFLLVKSGRGLVDCNHGGLQWSSLASLPMHTVQSIAGYPVYQKF